jgi:thiamine kinase-like enzyme
LDVTFWQYHPQNSAEVIAARCVATSLRRLHVTLSRISPGLRATLPSYLEELDDVRALLTDSASLRALSQADRHLLATTFDRLKAELGAVSPPESHVAIHGAPHLYNVLLADGEPRFIDFETACTGPLEWDLAHLDSEGEPFYGSPLKSRLLWVCRGMASVKAAVFCWADSHRGDPRDHAEWHFNHVRTSVAPYTIRANLTVPLDLG